MNEEWRPCPGFPDSEVSSLGRVRRSPESHWRPGLIRSLDRDKAGYASILMHQGGQKKKKRLHRMIAIAFLGEPPFEAAEVNHKDGDKRNCQKDNLEWTTSSGNKTHALKMGLSRSGERHWYARLSNEQVIEIRALLAGGQSDSMLAERFGVCRETVSNIRSRRTWNYLPADVPNTAAVAA